MKSSSSYCTVKSVQDCIYDCAQHTLDVLGYSTHKVVSNTEDISANDHRVNEANVSGSCGKHSFVMFFRQLE